MTLAAGTQKATSGQNLQFQRKQRKDLYRRIFDTSGMLLTVIALSLAVKQYYDLEHQREIVGKIATSVSTQPVGTFPSNMDAILTLISHTDKDIKIMADIAAYGNFSAPDKFERYLQELIDKKRKGQKITLIVYGGDAYFQASRAQWKEDNFKILLSEKNQHRLQQYFTTYHPDLGPVPSEHSKFLEALAICERRYRERMLENDLELRVVENVHDLPFFLWLRDDHEAVFSFYNLGDNVREISFQTRDGDLISAFGDVFKQVLAISKPVSKADTLGAVGISVKEK